MMYKTLSLQIKNLKKNEFKILQSMCWHSARLYNTALYNIRQEFFQTKTYLHYPNNYHVTKLNENYKEMPSAAAQQTIKIADRGFKSFFALLKKKRKGEYQNKTCIPHYLSKTGYFNLVYPNTGFRIKGDKIYLTISKPLKNKYDMKHLKLKFPTHIDTKSVKEIRIIPYQKAKYYKMEVVYEVKKESLNLNRKNVLGIDLGVNNLATCYDVKNNRSFIMDGKRIKNINYYWNKQNARLQSIKDKQNIKGYTEKQFLLKRKRENRVKDIMRKTAKYIIDYCIDNDIGTIVVGNNKGWKQEVNIGKVNNQNFVCIPFGYLINMLESKCNEYDMNFIEIQEVHTSKCSALDNEEVKHHDKYLGLRKHRGLFKSGEGYLINADVNAAINITRKSKYVKNVTAIHFNNVKQIRGALDHPLRIRI